MNNANKVIFAKRQLLAQCMKTFFSMFTSSGQEASFSGMILYYVAAIFAADPSYQANVFFVEEMSDRLAMTLIGNGEWSLFVLQKMPVK